MICLHCTSATASTREPCNAATDVGSLPSTANTLLLMNILQVVLCVQMPHCDDDQSTDDDRLYMCSDVHLRTSNINGLCSGSFQNTTKKRLLKDPKYDSDQSHTRMARSMLCVIPQQLDAASDTCAMRGAAQHSFQIFSLATAWQQYCMHGI